MDQSWGLCGFNFSIKSYTTLKIGLSRLLDIFQFLDSVPINCNYLINKDFEVKGKIMTRHQWIVFFWFCAGFLFIMAGGLYLDGAFDENSRGVAVIAFILYLLGVIPLYLYVKTTIAPTALKENERTKKIFDDIKKLKIKSLFKI